MKIINVFSEDGQLWTANLLDKNGIIKNLGGSYPRCNSASIDATRTWGNHKVIVTLRSLNKMPESYMVSQ